MPVSEAKLKSISNSRTWLKLVVYEEDRESQSGYRSAVKSQDFFLSSLGSQDPFLELVATIESLLLPPDLDNSQSHAACRFPARTKWLQRVIDGPLLNNSDIKCDEFDKWSQEKMVDSISIVFATGYLGNPASFYGHTLLKFNSSENQKKTKLADVSVNYGAIIPDNENPLTYIVKGIGGGYDAGFSHINYYFHDHNYGENELRDLWEYELSLDTEESSLVVAHAWELLGKKYTYYFLRKNCAYRMAELLEIIGDIDVKPENSAYLIPQALIQKLSETNHKGKKLVSEVKFHPSRQSRFYGRFSLLSSKEKRKLSVIINSNSNNIANDLRGNSEASQKKIVDTALDYYRYALSNEDNSNLEQEYRKVLAYRFTLSKGEPFVQASRDLSPNLGRNPSLTSVSVVDNELLGKQLGLRIRPAYYDSMDSGAGHIDYSTLSMADFELRMSDDEIYLNYFDIINVQSINSRTTGLPQDSNFAWNIRAGFAPNDSGDSSTVFRVSGDMGNSLKLGEKLLISAYIGGGIQDKKKGYSNLFVRALFESHLDLSDELRLKFGYERREFIDGRKSSRDVLSFMSRFETGKNSDIRLSYIDDGNKEFSISVGFYW